MTPRRLLVMALLAALALTGQALAAGDADVAALQVALRAHGVYGGPVDGVAGPATSAAVRSFQRKAGLAADGVPGPSTRAALGERGRPVLGTRMLKDGAVGWDVAQLQFLLASRGFPSGPLDGTFGPRTAAALKRFQSWADLAPDGVLGAATLAALRGETAEISLALAWPLVGTLGDGFGPRGDRFHTGLDILADGRTPVTAAAPGRVAFAGWHGGGWGNLVTVAHGNGVRTLYAHLSRVDVRVGQRVVAGDHVGLVGSTGHSTGPHLHFEVRLRGAAVDPLPALRAGA